MGTILNIVIIASAAVLIKTRQVDSFLTIALPFQEKLGNVGLTLFAVAFACAGISAVVTVALGSVYNTLGFIGLEGKFRRRFKLVFILWLIIAAAALLLPNQIQIMVFTQYMNGAMLPFALIPLILLTRNESIMGKYKLGKATITLVLAAIIITSLLFIISLISLL